MGSPAPYSSKDEQRVHQVKITQPFYLGVYQVTQAEYQMVMGENPSHFHGETRPVERVSWAEAEAFCAKLSELEKTHYRLPTEAEWEYACRAGSKNEYCFGDDLRRLNYYAWHEGNSGAATHPVGTRKPNAWGFYDLHGNVWEWCSDWRGDYAVGEITG